MQTKCSGHSLLLMVFPGAPIPNNEVQQYNKAEHYVLNLDTSDLLIMGSTGKVTSGMHAADGWMI